MQCLCPDRCYLFQHCLLRKEWKLVGGAWLCPQHRTGVRGGKVSFPYLKDFNVTFLFYKNLLMSLMGIIINKMYIFQVVKGHVGFSLKMPRVLLIPGPLTNEVCFIHSLIPTIPHRFWITSEPGSPSTFQVVSAREENTGGWQWRREASVCVM